MGERMGRIGRIDTDFFFCHFVGNGRERQYYPK
jgi:hypothetical protein